MRGLLDGEPEGMGSQPDKLIHAIAADNQLRCMAAVSTRLVGEACRRHQTFPTASVALGRTLTGGLLLGAGVKDLERSEERRVGKEWRSRSAREYDNREE